MTCPKCGSLLCRDRDGTWFCAACLEGEIAGLPKGTVSDPRRRHTPEEERRRKKHGGTR